MLRVGLHTCGPYAAASTRPLNPPLAMTLISLLLFQVLLILLTKLCLMKFRQVLGQLNLAVETMLMPDESTFLAGAKSPNASASTDPEDIEVHDDSIISTSNLLHIDVDSGFSGSSSSASYNGSFKRVGFTQQPPCHLPVNGSGHSNQSSTTSLKQFFSKKTWKKIPGFSSSNSALNKNCGELIFQLSITIG